MDPHVLELLQVLGLAVLCGGAIGLEREVKGRSAGFRTNMLVCVGSALIMFISKQMQQRHPSAPDGLIAVDPGRVAQGVVTGVGFLGAGAILKVGDVVRGLTTAASIWLMTGLGLAIGLGYSMEAGVATAAILMVLTLATQIERLVDANTYNRIIARFDLAAVTNAEQEVLRVVREDGRSRVTVLSRHVDTAKELAELTFHVKTRGRPDDRGIVEAIARMDGVRTVTWR